MQVRGLREPTPGVGRRREGVALDDGHGKVVGESARGQHPGHAPADDDGSGEVHSQALFLAWGFRRVKLRLHAVDGEHRLHVSGHALFEGRVAVFGNHLLELLLLHLPAAPLDFRAISGREETIDRSPANANAKRAATRAFARILYRSAGHTANHF